MNYFAHAYRFLDDPYFVAGTAVPDWLTVSDRAVRLRARHVEPLAADGDPRRRALGRGILQHLDDDRRFHATRAFAETSLALTAAVRDALGGDVGMRPFFLGHLLVEVLLDAALAAEQPALLHRYYALLDAVDPGWIQDAVNAVAPRPAARLGRFIDLFRQERVLWDYFDDRRLLARLNQVMRRVGLPPLAEGILAIFPDARRRVSGRMAELVGMGGTTDGERRGVKD